MYAAGLSYMQLKEYLTTLQRNDLLMYNDTSKIYKTNDKGFAFLESYMQINRMLGPAKIELER